jgi:hypothetical protein
MAPDSAQSRVPERAARAPCSEHAPTSAPARAPCSEHAPTSAPTYAPMHSRRDTHAHIYTCTHTKYLKYASTTVRHAVGCRPAATGIMNGVLAGLAGITPASGNMYVYGRIHVHTLDSICVYLLCIQVSIHRHIYDMLVCMHTYICVYIL